MGSHPRGLEPSLDSLMSEEILLVPPEPTSWLPSIRDQSLLPLKPINSSSRDTLMESSPTDAEPDSTTVSSLSDMEEMEISNTSSSRTHGDHHGETRDTSRWHQTSAVSPSSHPTHMLEQQM